MFNSRRLKRYKIMNDKIQFNVRIRAPYARAAKVASALMETRNDDLVEMAIRVLLDVEDEATKAKRLHAVKAWKLMGEQLPFEEPHNASHIMREPHYGIAVAPDNTADLGRGRGPMVGRLNGIQQVGVQFPPPPIPLKSQPKIINDVSCVPCATEPCADSGRHRWGYIQPNTSRGHRRAPRREG